MENQDYTQATEQQAPVEMIEIKFSRKLARPFTTKNGKDMVAISIPNQDQNDKRPCCVILYCERKALIVKVVSLSCFKLHCNIVAGRKLKSVIRLLETELRSKSVSIG